MGVCGIKNNVTNMIYVGKTMMNFGDRRDSHFSLLRNNKHWIEQMQNDWNKYGEDNFEFYVIRECKTDEEASQYEIYYIDFYKKQGLSYNTAPGGDACWLLGGHLSEEAKKKIGKKNRIHMTGSKMPETTKKKLSQKGKENWEKLSEDKKKERIAILRENAPVGPMDRNSEAYKKLVERERTHSNAAKYDIETVREIRRLHEVEGKGYTEISKLLDINRITVYLIATYRRWKYVS